MPPSFRPLIFHLHRTALKNKEPGGFERPIEWLLTRGLETVSAFFTPDKAARIRRQTTQQKPRPSKPAGMKSYQEDDYCCRQTYELLVLQSFKFGILNDHAVGSCHK